MILGTEFCRLSLALECELVDLPCEKKWAYFAKSSN